MSEQSSSLNSILKWEDARSIDERMQNDVGSNQHELYMKWCTRFAQDQTQQNKRLQSDIEDLATEEEEIQTTFQILASLLASLRNVDRQLEYVNDTFRAPLMNQE